MFIYTRWFKYYRDYLCVNKSQFVPVIFEPLCIYMEIDTHTSEMLQQFLSDPTGTLKLFATQICTFLPIKRLHMQQLPLVLAYSKAGLLTTRQYAFGTGPSFSMAFLCTRANSELVRKTHAACFSCRFLKINFKFFS
jgi:hypothetical protein